MGLTAQVSRRWHDPRGSSLSTTYKQPVAARRLIKGRHSANSRAGLDVKPPGARRPQKSARGVRRDPRRSPLALKRVSLQCIHATTPTNRAAAPRPEDGKGKPISAQARSTGFPSRASRRQPLPKPLGRPDSGKQTKIFLRRWRRARVPCSHCPSCSAFSMSATMDNGLTLGPKAFTGIPCRLTRNLAKFHLIGPGSVACRSFWKTRCVAGPLTSIW